MAAGGASPDFFLRRMKKSARPIRPRPATPPTTPPTMGPTGVDLEPPEMGAALVEVDGSAVEVVVPELVVEVLEVDEELVVEELVDDVDVSTVGV